MSTREPNHTVFVLGSGKHSEPLGEFSTFLTGEEIAAWPIGRKLLAATDPATVRALFALFARAVDAGGVAAYTDTRLENEVSVPQTASWTPYAHRQDVYAFDDGQWFVWRASEDDPQWYALALCGNTVVEEHPVARCYGARYRHTQGLELPELAAWILGEASIRLEPTAVGCMAYIVTEDEASPTLYLLVHAGSDSDPESVRTEVHRIAETHNWSNPCAPQDVRFHTTVEIAFRPRKHVCGHVTTEHVNDVDE